MKCYTVTENGVAEGIEYVEQPFNHVFVGNPHEETNFTRVEIDPDVIQNAAHHRINECSYILDLQEEAVNRACYKLINPTGKDNNKTLVKLEPQCADPEGRTFYEIPDNTPALATGWIKKKAGNGVSAPSDLLVLKSGEKVKIFKRNNVWSEDELVFTLQIDDDGLKINS